MIDDNTWNIVQKRRENRTRPIKSGEIDDLSGLLYCHDCGSRLNLHRSKSTPKRKEYYCCSKAYSRKIDVCTSHFIRREVIRTLILADLQRITAEARTMRDVFISKCKQENGSVNQSKMAHIQREIAKSEKRISELGTLFTRLYEDYALSRIKQEQFDFLSQNFDKEKTELIALCAELKQKLENHQNEENNIDRFLRIVDKYIDIQELNYSLVHEFISKIYVYNVDKEAKTQKIEIYYNFVGIV